MTDSQPSKLRQLRDHQSQFEQNIYAYPVVSRRSKGISLGVNLNPDKICNFDCIYCQVDRTTDATVRDVDETVLMRELEELMVSAQTGQLFEHRNFCDLPESWRGVNSIAFAGDGEPTSYRRLPEIVEEVIRLKQSVKLPDVPLVLITNATLFHRQHVSRALELISNDRGEVWAKLDAGSQEYYQKIERTSIALQQVLENITTISLQMPVVIQSLFMNINGTGPDQTELQLYCEHLNSILEKEGDISTVQIYTVARTPAESFVTPLNNDEVDKLALFVREQTGLNVEQYYGSY